MLTAGDVGWMMAMMPAFRSGEAPLFGLKAICVFPGNAAIGKDAHQGAVMLFDGNTGELRAIGGTTKLYIAGRGVDAGFAKRIGATALAGDPVSAASELVY